LIPLGIALSVSLLFRPALMDAGTESYGYSTFVAKVEAGEVKGVELGSDGSIKGELADGTRFTSAIPTALDNEELDELLAEKDVAVEAVPARTTLGDVLVSMLPMMLMIGLFVWMGRRARGAMAGVGGIGRSKAKKYDTERPDTRFADVAGYEGVKREVGEVVDFLKNPDRYRTAGAVGPKGVLMVGPPGTGKTMMARAVAGEAGVPFFSVTGSSFVEMFVGVGAARVRDLFADARKHAPSIIFIDEIDAIGQRRGGQMVSNDEREQTLNQMLAEMDGFDPSTGVVVIAATNRPETLDPALLRAGRFDRQVVVPLPTRDERREILIVHAGGKQLAADVDLDVVARATPGFSGAELANLVNESAIVAVRDGRTEVRHGDFWAARDRILLGRRDGSTVLLPEEKQAVAAHEAGHALVAALSTHADPVAKVTILPAGQALGVTEQLPVDERHLYSRGYLDDSLAVRLGGRAAELVVLGELTTGASNDLAGATDLATRMVREYGMSDQVGPVGFGSGSPMFLGGQEVRNRPYAEATQRVIDEEVARLLREAEDRAVTLLREHRDALDQLIGLLLEHETIDGSLVHALVTKPAPTGTKVPA
jgi:cell division protease FtsH